MEYGIVLDVWEGQLECNEAEFFKGGVIGIIIRLNDMDGGHHKDENFDRQWSQSLNFYPVPYFVYNPYKGGQENFNWLISNMPHNCPAVFIDTEVRMLGLSPAIYGREYNIFMKQCKIWWKTIIYTGAGFLDVLDPWPTGFDVWWAAYPKSLYPALRINVTWDQLHKLVNTLPFPPVNSADAPGTVKLHQCSGDRLIVPGSIRAMDISAYPGTASEYGEWLGYNANQEPTETTMPETLKVPFVSQINVGALEHNNDCGAASALMILKAYNVGNMTVDQAYNLIMPTGDGPLSIGGLQVMMANKGVKNEYKADIRLSDIFNILVNNKPVIALIHYAPLVKAGLTEKVGFMGAHFVVMIGMDVKYVYIHDPYSITKGNVLAVPINVFLQCQADAALDGNPIYAIIATTLSITDLSTPTPPIPPPTTGVKYAFGVNPTNNAPILAVNVRSGPSATYGLVKVLEKATTPFIYVIGITGDYGQLADKSGWVYIAYFKKI